MSTSFYRVNAADSIQSLRTWFSMHRNELLHLYMVLYKLVLRYMYVTPVVSQW